MCLFTTDLRASRRLKINQNQNKINLFGYQNQFLVYHKVVDQNRIFSLPKTFLVDQKS
jgi:hypothetical protein